MWNILQIIQNVERINIYTYNNKASVCEVIIFLFRHINYCLSSVLVEPKPFFTRPKKKKKKHTSKYKANKEKARRLQWLSPFPVLESYCWRRLIVVYSGAIETHNGAFEVLLHLSTFIETSIQSEGQRRQPVILIVFMVR